MSAWRQIEGRNSVLEALKFPGRVKKLFLSQTIQKDDRVKEIFRLAVKQQLNIVRLAPKRLSRMAKTTINQGMVALADFPPIIKLEPFLDRLYEHKQPAFLLVVVHMDYEQNLGAIIRSAELAGVHALIVPKNINPYTPVVGRVSMGAMEHLPIIQESLFVTLKILKKQAISLLAADQEAKQSIWQTDLKMPLAFIIGGEAKGMSDNLSSRCDQFVNIPMSGKLGSLNMSVAAGIIMFEVVRQRKM
ncbi:23S rRNA (guanosine(2251)-2'-O)-methyltransferase RlmB [Patescibacteria group bacterium]|nr:23S rRNA (guanosine(2251)-2'-O)-methyltransferase RlmB [Patescibacteria group bacterium]MBU1931739.1 23S rRNA (guanosine(2251)-2'-O)-methyltransferase RlmB [Patescibacteria group bacterium]